MPVRSNCPRLARLPLTIAVMMILLAGCSPLDYYWQAVRGQLDLLSRRQSIDRLVADPAIPEAMKGKLKLVLAAREFAAAELDLPVDGQFETYADLGRPYVVWNVFAAPEFSVTPYRWCYPVAGCAAYRGFFAVAAANAFADEMAGKGFDVHVGGVPAYSTLGWFDDPLPSSVILWPDADLAALIFHELAHRRLYLPGDTTFNESFATAVEREGLRRWMARQGRGEIHAAHILKSERQEELVRLVARHRDRLAALYRTNLTTAAMRPLKADIFGDLQKAYGELKHTWNGYDRFDGWFRGPLNNARLIPFAAYHDMVPGFAALLAREGGNLTAFYDRCRQLADKAPEERERFLKELSTPH